MKLRAPRPTRAAAVALAGFAVMAGCQNGPPTAPAPEPIERGPAPAYTEVAAKYNERVADMDLIWAQSVTRIWYTDDEGRDQSEQANSYLQYVAPDNVLLTIERFGKTFALLGANTDYYWWISLADDDRSAIVGAHESTTPQAAARAGLPVHPLDLLAIIGAAPLAPESSAGEVWWSDDGHRLMVQSEVRWGSVLLELDPQTHEPLAVEMSRGGRPAVSSQLGDYMPYALRSNPSDVRMPGAVTIYAHESGARIEMNPYDYHATSRRPNRSVFDLADLLARNRVAPENVRRVEDSGFELGAAPAAPAPPAPPAVGP